MLQSLMSSDPSFKGSLSSARSGRSSRASRTDRSQRSKTEEQGKSAVEPNRSSVTRESLEVVPIASGSRDSPNKLELTREWARMVQTGGVKVKYGTSCYFKDKEGVERFVNPPTESRSGGGL